MAAVIYADNNMQMMKISRLEIIKYAEETKRRGHGVTYEESRE